MWAFTLGAFGIDEERYFFISQLCIFSILFFKILTAIRKGEICFPKTPINLPLGLFSGLLLISTLFLSVYPYTSQYATLKWSTYLFLVYLIEAEMSNEKKRRFFVSGILAIGAIYTIIAFFLQGFIIEGFRILPSSHGGVALTRDHNHFVGVVSMLFFLSLGFGFSLSGLKKLSALFAILFGLAIILSTSRGGVVLLIICLGIYTFLFFCQKLAVKYILFFTGLILIIAIGADQLLSPKNWQHLKSLSSHEPDANIRGRLNYADAASNHINHHPLTGMGAGTFEYGIQKFKQHYMVSLVAVHPHDGLPKIGMHLDELGKHAYNDHIQVAAETGLLGYGLLVWAMTVLLVSYLKQFSKKKQSEQKLMLGIGCAVMSILLNCLTDLHLQTPINAILLCFCLGLMLSYSIHQEPQQSAVLKISVQPKPFTFAISIIIAAGFFLFSVKPALAFQQYQSAIDAFQAGDVSPAILKVKHAIFWENANAEYWSTEGYFWVHLADNATDANSRQYFAEQALPAIYAAIERCPVRAYYYSQLAQCYRLLGNTDLLEKALQNAAHYAPTHFQTLEDLANFYIIHNRFDEAKPVYKQLLTYIAQGVGENALSFNVISGQLQKLFSLLDKQYFSLTEFEGYFPQDPYVFHTLARNVQAQKDTSIAFEFYYKAIEFYPDTRIGKLNHAFACQELANLQFAKSDTTAALASIKKAYEKNPTPENAVRHAAFIKKIGLTTEAITLARQYHQLYQDNPHLAQLANGE